MAQQAFEGIRQIFEDARSANEAVLHTSGHLRISSSLSLLASSLRAYVRQVMSREDVREEAGRVSLSLAQFGL
ncbi:unnamed protein product [Boreogadus saida]